MKGLFKKARLGVIFISIIAFAMLGINWDIKTRGLTIEQKKALEYGELAQEDYSTDSKNVEFSAFFTTDADNDGYVERRKGATVDLGNQTKELYFELKVNREGYLKGGRIEIDNGNNFTWKTATISDNVVAGDYIGVTKSIALQDSVEAGNQKLFSGTINDKIGKNVKDYHKTNIVRLTGTYVDGEGTETSIDVAKQVIVDWYGDVYSDINTASQEQNVTTTEEYMIVEFDVVTMDRGGQLLLKDNNVTVTIPELNNYKAQSVTVDGEAVEIGDDNKISFHRSSQKDAQGNITKTLSRTNKYKIRVIYPIEARGQNEFGDPKTYTKIEIPVTSEYIGYNNQEEGFEHEKSSSNNGIIVLIKDKNSQGDYLSQLAVDIGTYCEESQKAVVSKKKAIQAYSDIEVEDDTFEVTWGITREKVARNLELQETKADEIVYNTGAQESLKDIVSYKGIYFKNADNLEDIRIYNAKTDELIASFESGAELTEFNPYMYDEAIEKVRVKIGYVPSNSVFQIRHIKEIDDTAMVNKYSKAQFDTMVGIYSYLSVAGDDVAYTEVLGYSLYREEEATAALGISQKDVSIRDNNINQTITITTTRNDFNQIGWKNGEFLVEFPEEVIFAKLQDVTINNNEVEIAGYNLVKENGKYLLKIITANEKRETYKITINCDIQLNPIMNTGYGKFKLYGYNEDCNEYAWSYNDIYDINENGITAEKVSYSVEYMQIVVPSTLLTSHFASNFDEEETIVIASNIADINKTAKTADININLLNNYDKTVSEVRILGTVPFENNTHIENDVELGSTFTATMKSKIEVPEELLGKVTVYYTENETATKDLEDATNRWTINPTDLTKVRRYLIDFGNNVISSGARMAFKYTVEIPDDVNYNDFAYSAYVAYFSLEVEGGLLPTQIEPNKLGLRIVRKYELDLTKQNVENNKLVPGAVYQLSEMDENNEVFDTKLVATNNEGKLNVKDLYVDRKYVLEEVKNPSNYMLNNEKIEFIVTEKPDRKLKIQVVSEEQFKTEPVVENNTISATISEHPRYQLNITKVDSVTQTGLSKVNFELLPQNENYTTTKQGKLVLTNLDQNVEYTLKETYAEGYYLLNDITFKLEKDINGNFKIISNNQDFQNATITVSENEDLVDVTLNLKNERKPSILITKVDSKTNEPIEGVNFVVRNRPQRVYVTGADGKVLINDFAENEEYVLEERKANGYYLQTIAFTVVRDANNNLKIQSDNQAFANQVSVDEATKVISVLLPNEPIPIYNLNLTKIEEDNISKTLQGAKFQLIEEDTNTIKEYTTNENGKINLTNLKAYVEGKGLTGYYVLKELEAPAGYSNNSEEIRFRVVKNANDELEVEIENKANMATIEIAEIEEGALNLVLEDSPLFTLTKIDKETGLPLANAKFVILDLTLPIDFAKDVNGNYVGTLNEKGQYIVTTDGNGKITLPLRNGKYAAIEVEFPEGYKEQDVVEGFEVGQAEEESTTPVDPANNIETIQYIETIEDLVDFSIQTNTVSSFEGKEIVLKNSLDFADDASYNNPNDTSYGDLNGDGQPETIKEELSKGKGFTPIGNNYSFSGTFNGNNKEIKNLYINSENYNTALFTKINGGTVKDLTISGKIMGISCIGGIVGDNKGTIENCTNNAELEINYFSSDSYLGGIAGSNRGKIKNCTNNANILLDSSENRSFIGGIVAEDYGTVENCNNNGMLILDGFKSVVYFGGIAGYNYGQPVKNSYNTNDIIISNEKLYGIYNSGVHVGGIVGEGSAQTSYNTGNINVDISKHPHYVYIGGVVGTGTATDSYNTGNINAKVVYSCYIGGVTGTGTANNCYNTGKIDQEVIVQDSSISNYLAGVGCYSVQNSYNTGDITQVITREKDSSLYNYVGGVRPEDTGTNSYNTGKIKITDVGNNTITDPEVNLEGVPDLTSEEYYNIINQNGVWVHLEGYAPRLLIGEAKKVEATKVEIPNTMKKFIITTKVDKTNGTKGGTITGEDTTPFETVKYGQNNTKAIVVEPAEGFTIESIKVNGKDIPFVKNLQGNVTLPAGYFADVKEDKNVVVKFAYKEQIVTINKVDSKNNTIGLEGAEFTIEAVVNPNEYFGKLTKFEDSEYYFEIKNGVIISNNENTNQSANSYIPLDLTGLTGEYYVVINATANNGASMSASISKDNAQKMSYSAYNTDQSFMWMNYSTGNFYKGIVDANGCYNFASDVLNGGEMYYINLHQDYPNSGAPNNYINSISLYKVGDNNPDLIGDLATNNTTRKFVKNSENKIILENSGETGDAADSYIPIDLTDKEGTYSLIIDYSVNSIGGTFKSIITDTYEGLIDNTSVINDQSPYGSYIYMYNNIDRMIHASAPLKGGKTYYLSLRFNGGAPYTDIVINNLRLVKGGTVEVFSDNNGDEIEVLDGNQYFGTLNEHKVNSWELNFELKDGKYTNIQEIPSRSYIEIDLRELEGKYNLLIDAGKGEYGTFTAQVTDNINTAIDSNEEGKLIYLYNETPETTYSSQILEGGKIYYLHMFYGGGSPEQVKFSNIRLVKNDTLINVDLNNLDQYEVVETFKNSNNKSYSGKFVTDNNGQIRVKVPRIGNYVITETKAPEGYTLSATPVYLRVNGISNNVVTIENTAKQKLTVHHYLKQADGTTTTIKVADDEVSTYDVGADYETAPKTNLQNVELEKDAEDNYIVPANAKGTIGANGEVVTYYYKTTPIELTINHYMEGEETPIAEEETIKYEGQPNIQNNRLVSVNVNQEYNVKNNLKFKDFTENENYENSLITQDAEAVEKDRISFTRNSNLTYYYAQRNRTITVQYVNKDTDETVAIEETIEKTVGQTYQIARKDIEGYTFVSSSEALSGIVSENKTITLYYKQNATATMNYIERKEVEGEIVETPLDSQTINGYVGEEITGIAKDIDGYMLVERPQQETIELEADASQNELNYYYEKVLVPSSVLVKHIDKYTNSIIENELKRGYVGELYQASAKEYTGYDLVQTVGDAQGEMAEEQIEVKFYYSRKITVTVQYINLLTEESIVENEVKNGYEGEEYTTTAKQLTGYDLFETPLNASGEMKATIITGENDEPTVNTNIVVTYGYKEKSEGVREKHIDKITGKILSQKQHNGYVGDTYQTSAKEFVGYELVESPEKPEGTMKKDLIEVNYYYKAKDFNFKIQKRISKILVDGVAQNIPNGKLAKLEIHRNALDETDLIVEYEIKVSNIGELAGGTTVLETIPNGFTMNESENEGWVVEGENARIVVDNLAAGEEKVFVVKLHWNRGEANLGTKTNRVAIIELKNDANFVDSDASDNEDSATLLLLISTGTTELGSQDFVFEIILTIITLMVVARIITVTKKLT